MQPSHTKVGKNKNEPSKPLMRRPEPRPMPGTKRDTYQINPFWIPLYAVPTT